MRDRFINAVRVASIAALAAVTTQPASAEIYTFKGTMTLCTGICSSFAALGAPTGGVANMTPSDVTGFIEIDVLPNGSFTEANVVNYGFEIYNSAVGIVPAMFTGETFDNPTEANPLPLDDRVVSFDFVPGFDNFPTMIFGGSGTTGPNNELLSGQLVATFTVPPFNPNGAQVYFEFGGVPTPGWLFGGLVQFTEIDSVIEQLPGEISIADNPTVFPGTAINDGNNQVITVTNVPPSADPCADLAPPGVPDPAFSCLGEGGPLTITSVGAVDGLAPPFSIVTDNCTGEVLAVNGTCTIEVGFDPTAAGAFADSFDIVSSDPGSPSVTVDVSGDGLEPNIQVTPFPLNFVTTTVGETSQAVATVRNTGLADLVLGLIDFSMIDAQFTVALDNCSLVTIPAGGTCTVTMEFAPLAEVFVSSDIVIPSNDPDTPLFNYEIQGEGIIGTIADISTDPTSLVFDEILETEMAELPVQVNSTGNDPLEITSITVTGTDAADFSAVSGCPATLDSGTNCSVTVIFDPASGGAKAAALTIVSNADSAPTLDVSIKASAFDGPRIEVDTMALSLGSAGEPVDVGAMTTADVTITSTGTMDLNVGEPMLQGADAAEFSVDNNGCTAPVAPLGSCVITVGFSPTTDADKMAELVISSDDVDNPSVTVTLTGFVFRGPRVEVPAAAGETTVDIDGGSGVEVGETTTFDLVINNNGTEDLEITGFALGGEDASEFSFTEDCVGTLIAPMGSCTVTITFTPESAGEKSAELSIFSNDVTLVRAATIVVPLSATATAPPPPPPPAAPGSQTTQPPSFARADPGGGATGAWLLGFGVALWLLRRRYR